eukprot:Ihof_evm15s90 gene=Ihof_evmTU15s90
MFGFVFNPLLAPLRVALEPQPMYIRTLVFVIVTILVSVAGEAINYALLYRKDSYKQIMRELEALRAKVDREKKQLEGKGKLTVEPRRIKALAALENTYKEAGVSLQRTKLPSAMASGLLFVAMFGAFNENFAGLPLARLPFLPFSLIQGMTHRGLEGEDYYEASYMCIYVLGSMAIRPLVQSII